MTSALAPTPAPPYIISWNLTRRCGLRCAHCYMESAPEAAAPVEMKGGEALALVDEVAAFSPGAMLILTGGEPLLYPHVFDVIRRASEGGLTVFLGTSGTAMDKTTAMRLKDAGVRGVGLSLDSAGPALHDAFRGMPGAWHKTISAMKDLRAAGLPFQVQFTVTEKNRAELPAMIDLSLREKAVALNIFFMVCTGRAEAMTDLTATSYEAVLSEVAGVSARFEDRLRIRARCAPHFLRVLHEKTPESPVIRGGTSGCIAGEAYMRIDPEGRVTPCPYIPPDENTPQAGEKGLREIWETDPAFLAIRDCAATGRCERCAYSELCRGCRARALAMEGDIKGPDPSCGYGSVEEDRGEGQEGPRRDRREKAPVWTEGARARLAKVPGFLRPMVSMGVERYARHMNIREITPEIMARLKDRAIKNQRHETTE